MDYARDPDWTVKFTYQRLNCKKWIFYISFLLWMLKRRHDNVAKHDAEHRLEQRNMNNEEATELQGKKVKFETLFTTKNENFTFP